MKTYLLTGTLLLAASAVLAQQRGDSLAQRLATAPADTTRVRLLGELTGELQTDSAARALTYGQAGLQLARQLHDYVGEAKLLNQLAGAYFAQEDLANATRYYQRAMQRAQHIPRAGRELTLALLGLGRVAVMQHDYVESQRYLGQARQRLQRAQYAAQPDDLTMVNNSLGVLYFDWLNSGQPYPDSVQRLSLRYSQLTLAAVRRTGSASRLAIGLSGVGNVYQTLGRYDSAAHYHRAALRQLQRAGSSPYAVAQTQVWLAAALVAQHHAPQALPLLQAARATAQRLHLPALQADCATGLAEALAATGQGEAAYHLLAVGHHMLDSLQRVEQEANLTRLRVQFDTEQARGRVRELTQRTQLQTLAVARQQQYVRWLVGLLLAVVAGLVAAGILAGRLRRERAALRATRAEQDRLYALIAHDLRSPVLAFSGLADLLTTYVEREDTTRLLRLGGRVRQTAESLRELLDNLLDWALAQRGELQATPRPLPVAELLADLDRLYRPVAEAAGVHLAIAATESCVLADRQMTLTILRNLLSNALRATPAGGRVAVQVAPAGPRQLQLTIADTGHGMSAEELAQVTSDYVRPTATQPRGRAGLGLRLSRLFARQQGGDLLLRSTPDQGTSATLVLPQPAVDETGR